MNERRDESPGRKGVAALTHMQKALELLDTLDLPVEVSAHLDLAINRLRDALPPNLNEPTTNGDQVPPSG